MQDIYAIENFFNTSAQRHGLSLDALNWGSKRTQELRFHVLSEIDSLRGKSILDVGCGFGDFAAFLTRQLGDDFCYVGVDISKEIVMQAREKHPHLDIRHLNILEEEIESFDYLFGSGIHNLKIDDNYGFFTKVTQRMFELAKEGIGTNFIQARQGFEFAEHIFAYELEKIVPIVEQLTPYVTVRTDYLPHDTTLFLYKNDWATRNNYHEA